MMKVNVYTKDNDKIVVRVLDYIDAGAQRSVYKCDYVGKDGKRYVIKQALGDCDIDLADSIVSNRFEFDMGHNPLIKQYLPEFKAISKRGVWLLVEECKTAIEYFQSELEADAAFSREIPEFLDNDMHSENWGYTLKDDRPVVMDLSYDEGDRSSVLSGIEEQAA